MGNQSEVYRWVVESSHDGLWMIDPEGRTSFANARMADLLGLTPEQMRDFSAYDALDDVGRASLREHLAELADADPADEGAENLEVLLHRPDGSSVWTLVSHSPVRDDQGCRIGWMHRVIDNTRQRELVETLRERERQLAEAQSLAEIGSWEWDVATDTVTWSDQLYRIYHLDPEDFEATYEGFLGFVHPEDRDLVRDAVGSVFAGADEFAWEARIIRHDGELGWIRGLGRAQRGPDGAPVKMGGTAQDITARKAVEFKASEAARRLQLLQAMATAANETNSLDEALELAAAGLPLYTAWVPVAAHRFEHDGTPGQIWVPDHDGWRPEPDPGLADRTRHSGQVELASPAEHADTHSVVAIPIRIDHTVVCVLELLADEVPPDENARALIDQIATQLSQVAQREAAATELAMARDEAMEASRLKSEFLATMSHEIRTPMNGVIGLNDLLLRTDLDPGQRRLAEGLQGAGHTLRGIIDDILDLSRIESGKIELEVVDFDVRAVFDRTVTMLNGAADQKGIGLRSTCDPAVPVYLRGDPVRLGQVLTNLVSNAVKFTDLGGVSIRASIVEESAERVVLRVAVEDSGVGIPAEAQERIFEAFTQSDLSTTRQHGGTGLGLAIARQLVHLLDGEICVVSTPGTGSTFTFTATFDHASAPTMEIARQAEAPLLHGRRILVVDDDTTTRVALRDQLRAWAMHPVAVASGGAALAAYQNALEDGEPFEIVVLDVAMSQGNALDTARALTDASPLHRPRLVLLSSGEADAGALLVAGISASLTKPVASTDLLRGLVGGSQPTPEPQHAAPRAGTGPRVLVAEDNQVNQMVAAGLLESGGFVVDIVDDGAAAVAALRGDHGYAAVLMDCRMPHLDGYDATGVIRAVETGGRRVPIIAMTASALEGEEARCRAAGMDDFLTKPVDPVRLLRVVRQWTSGGRTEPRPGNDTAEEPVPPDPDVLDLDRMRMLDELRRPDGSLFERASANFVAGAAAHLGDIRAAIATGDAAELTARAHKLKGSATNLGLPLVGDRALDLEKLGDNGTTAGAEAVFGELEAEMERALAALAQIEIHGL